jgi:hypothetical protein
MLSDSPAGDESKSSADFLSPAQFASASGLSPATVARYLAAGLLPKVQPGGPRHRVLIPASVLARLPETDGRQDTTAVVHANNDDVVASTSQSESNRSRRSGPEPRWKSRRNK